MNTQGHEMPHILVIDDDLQNLKAMRAVLEREGHSVSEAANGNEALTFLYANNVDLVLVDMLMPDMNGKETIAYIRQFFGDIPVIAMSGGGRLGETNPLHVARTEGVEHLLHKPFSRYELLRVVEEVLSLK
jgi:CheY-like chemotaxis protein